MITKTVKAANKKAKGERGRSAVKAKAREVNEIYEELETGKREDVWVGEKMERSDEGHDSHQTNKEGTEWRGRHKKEVEGLF